MILLRWSRRKCKKCNSDQCIVCLFDLWENRPHSLVNSATQDISMLVRLDGLVPLEGANTYGVMPKLVVKAMLHDLVELSQYAWEMAHALLIVEMRHAA